jgi:hypothetical protein
MHTFTVAKASFIVDDTEVSDREISCALRVRELLRQRMSDIFWSYVRTLSMTFMLDPPDEVRLAVRFELLIPDVGDEVKVEMSVLFLIDNPRMPEVVAITVVAHTEQLLRMHARETPAASGKLRAAASKVRK